MSKLLMKSIKPVNIKITIKYASLLYKTDQI